MDGLKNCINCGKLLLSFTGSEVCHECAEQYETDYDKIRCYLIEHPRSSIYEVATCLDVTISRIKRYLRDGMLEIVENDNRFLECETCGRPIHSGRYCDECSKHAAHDYKSIYMGHLNSKSDNKSAERADFRISFLTRSANKR